MNSDFQRSKREKKIFRKIVNHKFDTDKKGRPHHQLELSLIFTFSVSQGKQINKSVLDNVIIKTKDIKNKLVSVKKQLTSNVKNRKVETITKKNQVPMNKITKNHKVIKSKFELFH